MPPATLVLFERLSRTEHISKFFLIGGTALSINEQHRQSEDLDFVTTNKRLDGAAIASIVEFLQSEGCNVSMQYDPVQTFNFEEQGLDINDYHRDYVVDGVKLTFFTAESETTCALKTVSPFYFGNIGVADTQTLFRTKAVLLTKRATKRDIFDLHFLLNQNGYRIEDLFGAVHECHPTYPYESVRSRLLTQKFRMTDPGYDALVDRDISVDNLREDIHKLVDEYEVEQARQQLEEAERQEH